MHQRRTDNTQRHAHGLLRRSRLALSLSRILHVLRQSFWCRLDGYVMYGKWESLNFRSILDACNGHFGPVPAISEYGIIAIVVKPTTITQLTHHLFSLAGMDL